MAEVARIGNNSLSNGLTSSAPFLIGVSGGTASGKSTVCQRIMEMLGQNDVADHQRKVVCISQDSFYKELTDPTDRAKALKGLYNFDHPDAFDDKSLYDALSEIIAGKPCRIPVYDYVNNCRKENEYQIIHNANVVLVEGILVFYFPEIRELFDMKLFVDTDADTRLSRRVLRDTQERGRELCTILNQYISLVKPAFEEFCLPTKKHADVIIPRGAENTVAVGLIYGYIGDNLRIIPKLFPSLKLKSQSPSPPGLPRIKPKGVVC